MVKQYTHDNNNNNNNNTIEFHKSMYSNSHCIRISASCCRSDTPASKTTSIHVSGPWRAWQRLYGPLGVLHKDTVGSRACFPPLQTVEKRRGRNLWKCQLFSYLRCIYSLKMWQIVLQDRNKDVKMNPRLSVFSQVIKLSDLCFLWNLRFCCHLQAAVCKFWDTHAPIQLLKTQ